MYIHIFIHTHNVNGSVDMTKFRKKVRSPLVGEVKFCISGNTFVKSSNTSSKGQLTVGVQGHEEVGCWDRPPVPRRAEWDQMVRSDPRASGFQQAVCWEVD